MKLSIRNGVLLVSLSLLMMACSGRVQPDTTSRLYEVHDVTTLNNAAAKAFTKAGYTTKKAKLEKTVNATIADGKKDEETVYTYGPAELPYNGNFYRCMKLGTAKITSENQKSLYMVQLQAVEVTCYQSIGKMNFAVETDKQVYENYFSALNEVLGKEGKRIGSGS